MVDGAGEGSGSRRKGLHKTYLGRWLTLFRVQSIPISAVIVSMGYLLSTETVILREIWGILAVTVAAHAGINAQNDVLDYETDLENKENDKPIVSGDIKKKEALLGSSLLIGFSFALATVEFGQLSLLFILSVLFAVAYNIVSSSRWWSPFMFGAWGTTFCLFGASVASPSIEMTDLMLAGTFGLFTGSLIILGNVIDADADEESIHSKLGGKVITDHKGKYHIPGAKMSEMYVIIPFSVWAALMITQNLEYTGMDAGPILIVALMSFAAYKAVKITADPVELDDNLKRDFLVYIISVSATMLVVYSPLLRGLEVFVLFAGSLLWAVTCMKILYGKFFYFP